MTEEELDENYAAALDAIAKAMAENEEVDLNRFYAMTCILENLRFFSPVLYGVLLQGKQQP